MEYEQKNDRGLPPPQNSTSNNQATMFNENDLISKLDFKNKTLYTGDLIFQIAKYSPSSVFCEHCPISQHFTWVLSMGLFLTLE